ncbi:NAD(P)-binding domain-containing protein [Actinoplanes sp. NPDC024001]|uniref:NAD(P)-binding domain-containing protein n=1 Tax=Actinoplanes sp. NPDC024001 TaxID=3154598 RepID=UPI0033F069F1
MRIGVIGAGRLGGTLAAWCAESGHDVAVTSRHPERVRELVDRMNWQLRVLTVPQAATFGDMVIFAPNWASAKEAVDLTLGGIEGKVVIDATNPADPVPGVPGPGGLAGMPGGGAFSGAYPGDSAGASSGVYPGGAAGASSGVYPGGAAGASSGVYPGDAAGASSGVYPGDAAGAASGLYPGHTAGVSPGLYPGDAGVYPGTAAGGPAGLHAGDAAATGMPGAGAFSGVLAGDAGAGAFSGASVKSAVNIAAAVTGPPGEAADRLLARAGGKSGLETLIEWAPEAHWVKAFNTIPAEVLTRRRGHDPLLAEFVCTDQPDAREAASRIIRELGFAPFYAGGAKAARLTETGGPLQSREVDVQDATEVLAEALSALR